MSKFKKTRLSFDERISNIKFDFCKNLKWFLIAPILIVVVGVILLCSVGFNLGIDFTGGSNMTIYIDNDATYGEKLDINADGGKIEKMIQEVLSEHNLKISTIQNTQIDIDELFISKGDAVIVKYQNDNSKTTEEIEAENELIKSEMLAKFGYDTEIDSDYAKLVTNGGVTTATASSELMMKSFIALLVAVVLILIYVAFRFELTAGLAAILALFHDVLVTGSIVLMCRIQINVSFIAALITILGYSINNTIIIFDRMRGDVKSARKANEKINNAAVANRAVKDTMLRSLLTGITTFVMIFMVTVIGVPDIREFAFPIMIGILAGFYSSVFLTPGLWAIAYRPRKRKSNYEAKKSGNKKQQEEVVVEVVEE